MMNQQSTGNAQKTLLDVFGYSEFREGQELQIFGVVTHVLRTLKAG